MGGAGAKWQKVAETFKSADSDHNGTISRFELQALLRMLNNKFSLGMCAKLFDEIDVNGDGKLQYEEFLDFINFSGYEEVELLMTATIIKHPPSGGWTYTYTHGMEPERKGVLQGLKFHPDGTFTGTARSKHHTGNILEGKWINDSFEGTWIIDSGKGEKVDVPRDGFVITEAKRCKFIWDGDTYTGALQSDGSIRWSDGDVWLRDQEASDGNAKFTMTWSTLAGHSFVVTVAPLKEGVTATFKGDAQPAGRIQGSSMGKAGIRNDGWD